MSPEPRQRRLIGVEVHIHRRGKPYRRIEVKRSPVAIGRDPAADVRLDSGHISRRHAELQFDQDGMRLIDAGSRNGFKVRGERVARAGITADDTVTICEFELTFRPHFRTVAPFEAELSAGWADFDDEGGEPDTGVQKSPPTAPAEPMPPAPTSTSESVAESALSRKELLLDEELDPDELEEFLAPDLPPLLATMDAEADVLLHSDPHAHVGVEVIQTVGGRVLDVDLLSVGQSCWWGGTPRGLATLVVAPSTERFPLVSHVRYGEYSVQIPDGGSWKMFHRGNRQLPAYRSGPLIGCVAAVQDQIEISYGAFAIFVRCVRIPQRIRSRLAWSTVAPDRLLIAALLLSFGIHTSAMAIPWKALPQLGFRLPYSDSFVEVDVRPSAEKPAPPPPAPSAESPAAAPEKRRTSRAPSSPRPAKRGKPQRTKPIEVEPAAAPDPGPARAKSVSVSDFRISGMIGHLPTPHIDNPGSALRGGASIIRGGRGSEPGILGKNPSRMRLSPKGRLAREAVRRVVNRNAREIERCYNASLAHEHGLEGRVEIEWVVDRIGTVGSTRVIYDEVGSEALQRCLRTTIHRWVFPPPAKGAARVSFPFIFSDLRR